MGANFTTFVGFDVATPSTPVTLAAGSTSGALGGGNYSYKVTFVTAYGESDGSPVSANQTTTSGSINVSAIPVSTEQNVIARNLYRTTSGGGSWLFLDTIADKTTLVYTDVIADGSLGAAIPTSNTAMSRAIGRGQVALSEPLIYSVSSAVTAHAGGGQALATPLTSQYNLVTVVATAADSVLLPALDANKIGMQIVVKNNAGNACAVFPATGQFINALAVNTALSVGAGATTTFVAISATTWSSF